MTPISLRVLGQCRHLALHLAQQHPEDRALAADDALQSLELLGAGVSPRLAPQRLAFALVSQLELDACALGHTHDLLAGYFEQPAVGGVGNGLLLHRAVHNDSLELGGLDGLYRHGRLDGGLAQLLHACFAQQTPEPADLGGITRQLGLVVRLTASALPDDVLASSLDQGLVALVEGVLEVAQGDHQPDRQTGVRLSC